MIKYFGLFLLGGILAFLYFFSSKKGVDQIHPIESNSDISHLESNIDFAEKSSTLVELKHEIASLKSEYAALRAEVNQIKTLSVIAKAETRENEDINQKDQASIEHELHEADKVLNEAVQRQKDYSNQAFLAERQDMVFGSKVESELNNIVSSMNEQTIEVVLADCRLSMCRIKLYANTHDDLEEFVKIFSEKSPWFGPMQVSNASLPDGKLDVEILAAKAGHSIPMPQP